MAVSGPAMYLVPWACQGLIYWGSYARVEAYIYLCFVIRFWYSLRMMALVHAYESMSVQLAMPTHTYL